MHDDHDEEINSGEDEPVLVISPLNKKELGISSDGRHQLPGISISHTNNIRLSMLIAELLLACSQSTYFCHFYILF